MKGWFVVVGCLVYGSGSVALAQDPAPVAPEAEFSQKGGAPEASGADAAAPGSEQIDEILAEEEAALAGVGSTTYDPEGRRDPFRSLLEKTVVDDLRPRPPGVPGLLIDELDLKGIILKDGVWVAMVQAGKQEVSYLLRAGDELYDGDVVRISLDEVVFKQIVNDPKIFKPFREVVKKLNPGT